MKISTKGRYALRMMVDLAEHGQNGYVSLKEVAGRQAISLKYLEQIITLLNRAGYVRSIRGPQGGYQLTKQPNDYIVGDVLRLTEGSLAPVACLEGDPTECKQYHQCPTIAMWQQLNQAISDVLDHVTLEDLLTNKQNALDYMI